MASAREKVISGDYVGANCFAGSFGTPVKICDERKGIRIELTKSNVKNYEVLDAEERKSGTSGILRAAAGAMLLGPVGLAAGLTAKRKGIYMVAIEFYDSKKSLIEINEKAYKNLIRDMF